MVTAVAATTTAAVTTAVAAMMAAVAKLPLRKSLLSHAGVFLPRVGHQHSFACMISVSVTIKFTA